MWNIATLRPACWALPWGGREIFRCRPWSRTGKRRVTPRANVVFWRLKPSLVQVFPKEVHHILPLERPEWWVTCDSIGLFLETECRFPLESEDERYHYHEEHGLVPGNRQKGCGLTSSFVKGPSAELIDLYRRFVSPANPRFCFLLSSTASRGPLGRPTREPLRTPYYSIAQSFSPFPRLFIYGFYLSSFRHTHPSWVLLIQKFAASTPLSLDTPLLNSSWKILC